MSTRDAGAGRFDGNQGEASDCPSRVGYVGRGATAIAIAIVVVVVAVAGCGGVLSPDLFVVNRTGSSPGAKLSLLVTEEGVVECNPNRNHPSPHHLSDPQIIEARTIQEDLQKPASQNLSLPAAPGSVLSYSVRDQDGSVRFADNSVAQPPVTRKLALFVLSVAQAICHLPQQGA